MIPNTEHLPGIGSGISNGDLDAERFRAGLGIRRPLPRVPEEWQGSFTPETWRQFNRDRFDHYHTIGGIISPEEWLRNNK